MPAHAPSPATGGAALPRRRRRDRPRQRSGPLARGARHGPGRLLRHRRRELGWLPDPSHPEEERLTRAIANGLLHQDDPERLRWLVDQLQRPIAPDPAGFDPATERSWRMLMAQLWGSGRQHLPLAEALVRLWAAADLRAELVELFELLLERTDHLVTPLDWDRADPPPVPRPPQTPRPLFPRRGVRRLWVAERGPPFPRP